MVAKKKSNKFLLIISISIVAILAYFALDFYKQNFVQANVNTQGKKIFIYLPKASNLDTVVLKLKESGVVNKLTNFRTIAERKNYTEGNIVPGKYELIDGFSTNDLINHLRAGKGRLEVKVQFGQLRNINQFAGALAKNINPDSLEILNWLSNKDSIGKYGFNEQTIISFFIPNTYFFNWEVSTTDLMKRMAREYKTFWNEERRTKAQEMGLSQSAVTTMASIVYWETKEKEDIPKIAGVYMNRMKLGMPLQADPTLIFAWNDYSIRRVLNVHKEIASPYNTYKNKGLPPGPILSPPIRYIDAVLDYTKHDYLYFVAKEDFSGYSYFAKSYRQHLVYARRFQKALNQRGVFR